MRSIRRSGWKLLTPMARTRPCAVELLHGPPGAVDVAVGLVDQVEVEVVELQPLQRALERRLGRFVAGVRDPELGGDEDLARVERRCSRWPRRQPPRCRRKRRCRSADSRRRSRRATLRSHSAGSGTWKTPKPRSGISTPLFSVTRGISVIGAPLLRRCSSFYHCKVTRGLRDEPFDGQFHLNLRRRLVFSPGTRGRQLEPAWSWRFHETSRSSTQAPRPGRVSR